MDNINMYKVYGDRFTAEELNLIVNVINLLINGGDSHNRNFTSEEKTKLANLQFHPATHSASIIDETVDRHFMTSSERTKLSLLTEGADIDSTLLQQVTEVLSMFTWDKSRDLTTNKTDSSKWVLKITSDLHTVKDLDSYGHPQDGDGGAVFKTDEDNYLYLRRLDGLGNVVYRKINVNVSDLTKNLTNDSPLWGMFLRKDIEDIAKELITFEKGIKIGGITISWDAEKQALKFNGNVYTSGSLSSLGNGTTNPGGGGSSIFSSYTDWENEPSQNSLLSSLLAKALYNQVQGVVSSVADIYNNLGSKTIGGLSNVEDIADAAPVGSVLVKEDTGWKIKLYDHIRRPILDINGTVIEDKDAYLSRVTGNFRYVGLSVTLRKLEDIEGVITSKLVKYEFTDGITDDKFQEQQLLNVVNNFTDGGADKAASADTVKELYRLVMNIDGGNL